MNPPGTSFAEAGDSVLGRARRGMRGVLPSQRLARSAGVRFSLIYAGLFGISALALAAFLWWSTAGLLDRQTDDAINADSQGLAERFNESGIGALVDTINQRLSDNVSDDAIYLLVDPNFHRIAGNLEGWPRGVTMDSDWFELPIERAGIKGLARIHHFDVAGGFHLLIGRDVEARAQLRHLLGDAMVWAATDLLLQEMKGYAFYEVARRMAAGETKAQIAGIAVGKDGQEPKNESLLDLYKRRMREIQEGKFRGPGV